jgi:hypothetical protein
VPRYHTSVAIHSVVAGTQHHALGLIRGSHCKMLVKKIYNVCHRNVGYVYPRSLSPIAVIGCHNVGLCMVRERAPAPALAPDSSGCNPSCSNLQCWGNFPLDSLQARTCTPDIRIPDCARARAPAPAPAPALVRRTYTLLPRIFAILWQFHYRQCATQ